MTVINNTFKENIAHTNPGLKISYSGINIIYIYIYIEYESILSTNPTTAKISAIDNKFSYNFGIEGGPIFIEAKGVFTEIKNLTMESNIIFHKGASVYLNFDSQIESIISIENITFKNCYGSEMGCIIAYSSENLLFNFLQIRDIYLNIIEVSWLTAFEKHFNNLSYIKEKYSYSIFKYNQSPNPECMAYPNNYFKFEGVSTEVINFQLLDTDVTFNESCLSTTEILTFPSFFLYSNIKLAAFGKSISHINKSNEDNDILSNLLTALPDSDENCIYDQIIIKSKVT